MTRVMVVDDHPMWREAVARDLAEAGHDVVATAGDGGEAVRRAPAARPEVVVLDLQLPVMSGVEVTRALVGADPTVRVLVLSASGEHADVLEAVKAGATGYLVKSASREELLAAVERTALGEAVFTPGLAGLVLGEYRRLSTAPAGRSGPPAPQLTERETEVLRLVAKGLSYKQIAERLVLSHRTVQNHVQNTLNKLQMHNRVELVRYAIEQGLDDELRPPAYSNDYCDGRLQLPLPGPDRRVSTELCFACEVVDARWRSDPIATRRRGAHCAQVKRRARQPAVDRAGLPCGGPQAYALPEAAVGDEPSHSHDDASTHCGRSHSTTGHRGATG